ncbi:MAG: tetratricopeptide repeat protein [bacterium]|nr:tetratricopeptide repeat protein [bacterium]
MKPTSLLYFACLLCGLWIFGSVSPAQGKKKDKKAEVQEAEVDSARLSGKHLSYGDRYLKQAQKAQTDGDMESFEKTIKDAETQLTKAWNYNPTDGRIAYRLGKIYNATENYEEAISWFTQAIDLAPDSKDTPNAYHYLSQIYVLQENRTEAIQIYKNLLEISPEPDKQIQYLHHLVALYVEEQDYEAALEYARKWGELAPNDPNVQDTIAKLALNTGEEDEALVQMERVLEMTPGDYATLARVADMYRKRGMTQKAFTAYEKLSKDSPDNFLYFDYLLSLGKRLGKSESYQTSILRKMNQVQPDNLMVIEQLADATGSIDMVNRGLRLDPRHGKLLYMKGEFYYKKFKQSSSKKDSVEALNWFKKAQQDPMWAGNAKRMIDELDPPMSEEEKMKLKFFNKKKKEEEVDIKGKK